MMGPLLLLLAAVTLLLRGIAREAGIRSKVAVMSHAAGVDAVGTFVGGRGSRVQAVMSDLGEEKIDIIPYSDDPQVFIANALSPTKVASVQLDEQERKAIVRVPEDQLSLAIGKQGQNVRLAAKLTGWNIDILSNDESKVEAVAEAAGGDVEATTIESVDVPVIDSAIDEAVTEGQVDVLSGQSE